MSGLAPGQLGLRQTEVFGPVSGPAWWRLTFREHLQKWGYQANPNDRCIRECDGSTDRVEGLVVTDMDGTCETNEEAPRSHMEQPSQTRQFGETSLHAIKQRQRAAPWTSRAGVTRTS